MDERRVAVLGASSLVGQRLLSYLAQDGWQTVCYSRQAKTKDEPHEWRCLAKSGHDDQPTPQSEEKITFWICVAPLWVLPEYFPMIQSSGVRRIVVLSSTSRFTKADSGDVSEQALAARLSEAEAKVRAWAEDNRIEWVILRPTLIYGFGQDKNIAEIARFIRRFKVFPVLGRATGLRQPIFADDVAIACRSVLTAKSAVNRAYNISGGETLSYREMVSRVFSAAGRPPRLLTIPLWAFRLAVTLFRLLPRYRHWSAAMAERMNRDMLFDHDDARRDFDFRPRRFQPDA